jgi:hypothetical protein
MDNLEEILRRNPKAAKGIDSIKQTIDSLNQLRQAGIARGPSAMPSSYGGRPNPGREKAERHAVKKLFSK